MFYCGLFQSWCKRKILIFFIILEIFVISKVGLRHLLITLTDNLMPSTPKGRHLSDQNLVIKLKHALILRLNFTKYPLVKQNKYQKLFNLGNHIEIEEGASPN